MMCPVHQCFFEKNATTGFKTFHLTGVVVFSLIVNFMDKSYPIHAADTLPCARCPLLASHPTVPAPASFYCPSCAPPTGLPLCPACDVAQHAHPRRANHGAVTPVGGSFIASLCVVRLFSPFAASVCTTGQLMIPANYCSWLLNIRPPISPQSEYERQPVTVWVAYPPRPASSRLADLFEMPQAVMQLLAGCDTLAQLL
jgi:hypothetical protein